MMKPFALGAAVLLLITAAARGSTASHIKPDSIAAKDTSACADSLHPSDTIPAVVKISVRHQDTTAKLPPDFELLLADEFRSRFKPPRELHLDAMQGDACDSAGVCRSATARLRVVAYAIAYLDGTMPVVHAVSPSLNTELADSVRSALLSMGSAKMVPFFQADKPIPIKIIVDAETAPDSLPAVRRLFRANLPHYAVEFRSAWINNQGLPPYNGRVVPDTLDFEFTVMPNGRVEPRSIDVLHYRNQEYLEWAVKVLPKMVFKPASLGGCPAPQWGMQRFVLLPGRARYYGWPIM